MILAPGDEPSRCGRQKMLLGCLNICSLGFDEIVMILMACIHK